ncbi:hypothetical protein Q765_01005 [Flavobacterium rivuli WB 3.3-2 = DSM 21788]|uniref:Uncharacterized protein n=1 Tax=Flavobacterium rivuli WB 3.3-2 = DSM 21788 TaxID=1121895 RepID=A0A0A2MA40_9FLAO|nr:hypothetical protein [Flavobacterium rivuli]KGO88516.1 hypothetical protein Q765_01005 [Flavobacterium rivuli WB 3.3-2 = DSM 21788]
MLRQYLEHITNSEDTFKPYIVKSAKGIDPGESDTYKGIFLLSFRGIFYIIMSMTMLSLLFIKDNIIAILTALMCITIFYLVFGITVYYVRLNDSYLIVKNHLFFWYSHVYYLTDIDEVIYETQSKQPNNLRIITKDYKNKVYGAGTLSDNTLRRLKRELEKRQIHVRNEIGI